MAALTIEDVQDFLRDHPQVNILLDEVEHPENLIEKAIAFTVDFWNALPPASNNTASKIPRSILLLGTSAWLLRSMAALQLRNQATVRDGIVSPIGIDDKYGQYMQLAGDFHAQFTNMANAVKVNRNCESAYGSLGSGFKHIPRY